MGLVFFRGYVGPERPKIFYFILLKKNCWDGGYMLPDSI
jgi:hypothetical protein